MPTVFISSPFDDVRSADIRLIEEASRLGPTTVALWSDEAVLAVTGRPPRFPLAERAYLVDAIRYVSRVEVGVDPHFLPEGDDPVRVLRTRDAHYFDRASDAARAVRQEVVDEGTLRRFPMPPACPQNPRSARKKVLVTGCFDWFHSGHVRFFEEVSQIGDLYAVAGHDANIRLLKGEGHPLFPQAERCYVAGAIRFATMALVSTGDGWLDAEPEVDRLRPDVYAVNEDGDRPEKREFCARKGIQYVVLKRTPKAGLEPRASTTLRGF